jgi:hypothetical protein
MLSHDRDLPIQPMSVHKCDQPQYQHLLLKSVAARAIHSIVFVQIVFLVHND